MPDTGYAWFQMQGQLLFSGLRPYLNKLVILDDYEEAIGSAELFICEPKEDTYLPFVKYYLLSESTLRQNKWILSGSNYPRLGVQDFLNLLIVIPEKEEEQEKITEQIEVEEQKSKQLLHKMNEERSDSRKLFEVTLSY